MSPYVNYCLTQKESAKKGHLNCLKNNIKRDQYVQELIGVRYLVDDSDILMVNYVA